MERHMCQQKPSGSTPEDKILAYITYRIVYGKPAKFIPVHITMDRNDAHVVSSRFRNDTGYDYIVYAFKVEDIGAAMMASDKDCIKSYQYAAKRLHVDVLSNRPKQVRALGEQYFTHL